MGEEGRSILHEATGFGLAFVTWWAATLWFVPALAPIAAPLAAMSVYSV